MVLVIAIYKESSEVPFGILLKIIIVSLVAKPDTAKVTCYDQIVVLSQFFLLGKIPSIDLIPVYITMRITRNKESGHTTPSLI